MPRGLRQIALSISFLSPIVRGPDVFLATKIASLIFRPERRFFDFTSFQRRTGPSLSFGSSSLISLRRSPFRFRARAFAHRETSTTGRACVSPKGLCRASPLPALKISPFLSVCSWGRFTNHCSSLIVTMKLDHKTPVAMTEESALAPVRFDGWLAAGSF